MTNSSDKGRQSLFQWQRIQRFNLNVWVVLSGTLLARTSYFMAWPFLIVFLFEDYQISAFETGTMLASSAVIGTLAGVYSGYISDLFGRKWVMISGSLLAGGTYAAIGFADQLWQFYVLIMLCGLMRPMIEAPAKAVIGDNLSDAQDRELALNLRYFLINVGGALGPLIGITLALSSPQQLFVITGMVFAAYAVWLFIGFMYQPEQRQHQVSDVPKFGRLLQVIGKDKIFMVLVFANILMMFVYGQIEASIPQIIVRGSIEDAAALIASLVMINTVTIVTLQFPVLKLLENISTFQRTRLGMVLMGVAQIAFMLSPLDAIYGWMIACFILSLGEVIAFPSLSVQIDQLAPAHLRGTYHGAASVYALGFALAPFIGGIMLQWFSATWLFALCLICCVVMYLLYGYVESKVNENSSAEMQQLDC